MKRLLFGQRLGSVMAQRPTHNTARPIAESHQAVGSAAEEMEPRPPSPTMLPPDPDAMSMLTGRPPNPELLDEYSRQVSEQALKQVLSSSASAPSTAQGGAKKEPPGYEDGQAAPWPGEGAFAAMKGAVQRQSPQASSQPAPSASDPQARCSYCL